MPLVQLLCRLDCRVNSQRVLCLQSFEREVALALMAPPKKIKQNDHEIGYWSKKRGVKKFIPLATFSLRLRKHVSAPPELPTETGFIVSITQKAGDGAILCG